ncbi:MAG: hypothetical protein IJ996_00840 [Clostridia bacterium]|nr:hypothetical protein [Clostridia bacterium]
MDVFYEESAINANSAKNEKRYKVLNVGTIFFMTLAIFFFFLAIMLFPVKNVKESLGLTIFFGGNGAVFLLFWFILSRIKKRINVSYDYTFVSGELRIIKVFNVNKRKRVDVIHCDEILQMGDADNPSYERLRSAPNTKEIICTSNYEPMEGKFFMYLLVGGNQMKYLFLLECREQLLMQLLKFTRRSVLESDYVMQEKKQKKTTV